MAVRRNNADRRPSAPETATGLIAGRVGQRHSWAEVCRDLVRERAAHLRGHTNRVPNASRVWTTAWGEAGSQGHTFAPPAAREAGVLATKLPPSLSGVVMPVAPAPKNSPTTCPATTSSMWAKK